MKTQSVQDLSPATIALLSKLLAQHAGAARPNLAAGEHKVSDTVTFTVSGTVKVGADYEQRFVNKAKPWNLIYLLLQEVNEARAAADKTGVDIAQLVKAAEALDPKLVEKAKAEAEKEAAAIKAPTKKTANGKVTTKGTLGVVELAADEE
jgi:hypothetical protein